jgi:hypothetical protein
MDPLASRGHQLAIGGTVGSAVSDQSSSCAACGRALDLSSGLCFRFATGGEQTSLKCVRCAPRHPPLLRKALATSLVVGTILTLINQGDLLLAGNLTLDFVWKIPLTYFVPFAVSSYSALAISRVTR